MFYPTGLRFRRSQRKFVRWNERLGLLGGNINTGSQRLFRRVSEKPLFMRRCCGMQLRKVWLSDSMP